MWGEEKQMDTVVVEGEEVGGLWWKETDNFLG